MRSVGLDLGARHIAFCEVRDGRVMRKRSYRRLSELVSELGPETARARVAFEACREGWVVYEQLKAWGHEPLMLDTTRVRRLGVGQHGRKNDALDAEVIALSVERNDVPLAHVLSPARRVLRHKLSVRGELVEMRARQVTLIRGLARAAGTLLPSSSTTHFLSHVARAKLEATTTSLIAPIVSTLEIAETQIATVDAELALLVADDPMVKLCMSVPGVGIVVAATYISVLDDAKRFRSADAVASYFGLAPGEATTGGPSKRRLGGITKQGNSYGRTMLVQAAWQLMRIAPEDDPLRIWARQVAARRTKKVAAIALARRLSTVLWAICRDGVFYDPKQLAVSSEKEVRSTAVQRELVADALATVARKLIRRVSPHLKKQAARKTKKMSPGATM